MVNSVSFGPLDPKNVTNILFDLTLFKRFFKVHSGFIVDFKARIFQLFR